MVVGRFRPAMCGCADFVDRVRCGCHGCFAVIYCHCVVREDERDSGSSGFFSLFFYPDFSCPLFNSSPSSTPYSGLGHFQSFHARCYWPLLSTCLGSSACLIAVDGARCFYAYHFCGELVKTVPTDAMIFNRQLNQCPRLVSSISPPVVSGERGGCRLLGGVSFPVIFVLFRCVPELSISSGIMRLCCDFLLACRAGDVIGFVFSFRPSARFSRCSCRVRSCDVIIMSSARRVACLPYLVMSSIVAIRFAFLCSPLVVSSSRPARRVVGRGEDGAACFDLPGSCW